MNRTQIIGIGLVIIGITVSLLTENNILDTLMGVLSAFGFALVLKWIPFKKRNSANNKI